MKKVKNNKFKRGAVYEGPNQSIFIYIGESLHDPNYGTFFHTNNDLIVYLPSDLGALTKIGDFNDQNIKKLFEGFYEKLENNYFCNIKN